LPLLARFSPREVIPDIYERFGGLLLKRGVPVEMVSVIIHAFDILVIGSATIKMVRDQTNGGVSEAKQPGLLADWERADVRSEEEVFRLMCRALGDGLSSPSTLSGAKRRARA
jgi:hypothetical protein